MSLEARSRIKKIIVYQKLLKITITQSNYENLFNPEQKICQEVGTISMVQFDYLKEESQLTNNNHPDADNKEKLIKNPEASDHHKMNIFRI